MLWKSKSVDDRRLISPADLQSAIAQAVKESDPDCKAFIDVIIDYTSPKSELDTNWFVRGIRFGRSDRQKATQALTAIVERMQREFKLLANLQDDNQ